MTIGHVIGIVGAVALIEVVGIHASRKVKSAADFTKSGGRAGAWLVCGTIMAALIGGQSTIGTAQLAFSYGISAWWFTVGCALGSLAISLVYGDALRRSGCSTVLEVVGRGFGRKVEITGSVLCSIGIFISVVAQVLSTSALLTTLFPIGFTAAAVIGVAIMTIYVVFGGLWSAGLGGVIKVALLCLTAVVGAIAVLTLAGGFGNILNDIHDTLGIIKSTSDPYMNVLARGVMKDLGGAVSVVLGVICTQSYALAIWAAKSTPTARRGGILAACLSVPIGVACVLIGMYMRGHYVTADEVSALGYVPAGMGVIQNSAQAFPRFVVDCIPGLPGGVMLGTMLITTIIAGAGLALGSTTIVVRDVLQRFFTSLSEPVCNLRAQRLSIVVLMALAVLVAAASQASFINDLGFLSMGLRATVVLLPLTFALWFPGRFRRGWILASILAGICSLFVFKIMWPRLDPTFPALAVCLVIALCGYRRA